MARLRGAVGPSYTLSTIPLDCQRTINMYLEVDELQTGKDGSPAALVPRPGLTKFCQLPTGPIRGMWRVSKTGEVYAVGGNILYTVNSDGSYIKRGTLKTDSGAVSISDNGIQVIVVDGVFGYILTLENNIFTTITSEAFYSSNKVTFIDGYFVLVRPDSDQVYISGLYDGLSYDGLDFTTIEANPDKTVSLISYRNQLVAFGARSTSFYYDSGDASFPFTRVQGALLEHGCNAPLSPAKDGDLLFWLGEDEYGAGVVYKASGYEATRASNYGVEKALQSYGDISDAVGYMFQTRGHAFYVLNLTNAGTTWVHDVGTGAWYEWQSMDTAGNLDRWRPNTHVFGFGKHLFGDYEDGRIYFLNEQNFTDDGLTMLRRRRIPPLSNNLKRLIHSKLQLDALVGTGTDGTDQGQDPQVMLRYSDDGGLSWSSENWAPLGRIGQTLARVIWRRLGFSRNRVYEITVTDPVDFRIIGVDLDATPAGS